VGKDNGELMAYSTLYNPPASIWNKTLLLERWKDVGYNKGAELNYTTLSIGAATPTTISDIKAAIANPGIPVIILPQGNISFAEILEIKRSNIAILGHPNGTNLIWTKDLFELFGFRSGASEADKAAGKYGYSWSGGSFWCKIPEGVRFHDIIIARMTLTYKSPYTYLGHWREKQNVCDGWPVDNSCFQDLTIINADNSLGVGGNHITMRRIVFKKTSGKTPYIHAGDNYIFYGHYGGAKVEGEDNLFDNIDTQYLSYHDLYPGGAYCVFTGIKGENLNIDFHHNGGSYNLLDNIITGKNTRPWNSAARDDRPNTGPGNVFWNLRTGGNQRLSTLPPARWWVDNHVVTPKKYTVVGHTQSINDGITFVEPIGMNLTPASLYYDLIGGSAPGGSPPVLTNKFAVNQRVKSIFSGIRTGAGVEFPLVSKLPNPQPNGALGTIVSGPIDDSARRSGTGGFIWYNVNFDTGADGWSKQTRLEDAGLPPASGARFAINARVKSIIAAVRSGAGITYTKLGEQPSGAFGTVTEGPTVGGDFTWYKVNFDSGVDGWAKQDRLIDA
jgi:hypothetical protein